MDKSDEVLVQEYRTGDQEAFALLLSRHAKPLLGFLCRLLDCRADAEDVFQETFRRMLAKLDTYDAELPFKPWLYRIAQNLAIDHLRQQKRRGQHDSLDETMAQLADPKPTPAEHLEKNDRKRQVRAAVAGLAPRQRATLMLAYFHGLSYPEVAAIMECSVGTVKTQMSRALRTLALSLPEPDQAPVSRHDQA